MSIAFSTQTAKIAPPKINKATSSVSNSSTQSLLVSPPIIDIHVSCENLPKLDIGSPSDPLCVLLLQNPQGKWVEFDRTEVVWNNQSPNWVKFFRSFYIFQMTQPIRFEVYDVDNEKASLNNHDFIGFCETNIQTLVTEMSQKLTFDLKHPTKQSGLGSISIVPEQEQNCVDFAQFQISFSGLRRVHTFSKDNPFLIVSRPSESGTSIPCYKTNVENKCFSGHFPSFEVSVQDLCNGDRILPINFSMYHFSTKKEPELIGSVSISLKDIETQPNALFNLTSPKLKNKSAGKISFAPVTYNHKYTFIDYLRAGLQINMITAIDFTASNRIPIDPRSLHYLSDSMNSYERSILEVGNVICPYDSDQIFPVYGFGGKIDKQVEHCFPLTFDRSNPNVAGLQSILGAYRAALSRVMLLGPTYFAPVINAAIEVSRASFQSCHAYTVLLILTDGVIQDTTATIDAIVEGSDAPLSIIIVGIGGADFSNMDKLDADINPLKSSNGKTMKRDIVQFVPFSKFHDNGSLAAEVLAELPAQVDEFCKTHGFMPQVPPPQN